MVQVRIKMREKFKKDLTLFIGVSLMMVGFFWIIPFAIQNQYFLAGIATISMVIGLIFFIYSFGDTNAKY